MTTTTLSPCPVFKGFANDGTPLAFGKLFTYAAGTSTKVNTFTDSTGVTPNTNPVILNSRGEAQVWLTPNVAYKFVLAPVNDTDPPTNPIWSVDQIVNAQFLTLYGGVDTGVVNAYILTFAAPFNSYVDGITINWIPSHTNTGASTINVNGLGVVAITNQDGTPLVGGQLIANQFSVIVFKGGSFLLTSFQGGTPGLVNIGGINLTGTIAPTNGVYAPLVSGFPGFGIAIGGFTWLTGNVTGDFFARGISLCRYAGTSTSRASNTTITADPWLTVNLGIGTYAFTLKVDIGNSTTAGGIKFYMQTTGGTSNGFWRVSSATFNGAFSSSAKNGFGSTVSTAALISNDFLEISGIIQVTVATTTLSFNWAQNSSNAVATVVSQFSDIVVTQVS